ncbi:ParB/RepB/Spo0J family partition protein [Candidatus Uhrbacteria bacterium]|nr:ParB/RepB/Spo0J family partition protein [Candidatus Uhrbacteria bacterium]
MAKRPSGLGRGLDSLIPSQDKTAASGVALKTVPDRSGDGSVRVPISAVIANPDQPRVAFRHHELEELTDSIREHGIIQPLTVTPNADGTYELIAGERRLRAAKMAGLESVPVMVRQSVGNRERLILALIENIQREDLNPVEEAAAYDRMSREFGMKQEDIAKKVGKARSTVANTLRLLELPSEIREAISEGVVAAGTARAILSLKDDESRMAFFRKMMDRGGVMTTRQAESTVRRSSAGNTRRRKDPAVTAAEERIRNCLGTRIDIKKKGSKGSIVIGFYSEEEFGKLVGKLEGCK